MSDDWLFMTDEILSFHLAGPVLLYGYGRFPRFCTYPTQLVNASRWPT